MAVINPTVTDNFQALIAPKDKTQTQSSKAQDTLNASYQDFLKMLTTQLQNQDPTDPMKTETFTAQIAALSGVEQQVNTNKNLEQMIALLGGGQLNTLVGYIGKKVEAEGDKGVLTASGADFTYRLDQAAQDAVITITDLVGKVVFVGDGLTNAGKNSVIWDGKNSITGETMAPGTYMFSVAAKDATGKKIGSATYTSGTVTSADLQNGKAVLSLGTIQVPVDKVLSVKQA